jgi:hypothetical protein
MPKCECCGSVIARNKIWRIRFDDQELKDFQQMTKDAGFDNSADWLRSKVDEWKAKKGEGK